MKNCFKFEKIVLNLKNLKDTSADCCVVFSRTDLLEQLKEAKRSRPRSAVDPPIEMFGVNLEEED